MGAKWTAKQHRSASDTRYCTEVRKHLTLMINPVLIIQTAHTFQADEHHIYLSVHPGMCELPTARINADSASPGNI